MFRCAARRSIRFSCRASSSCRQISRIARARKVNASKQTTSIHSSLPDTPHAAAELRAPLTTLADQSTNPVQYGIEVAKKALDDLLPFIHGSAFHNDMKSYLEHIEQSNAAREDMVHKGTLYEYTLQEALASLGFALARSGRASDRGVDLLGYWALHGYDDLIPVMVQAKCTRIYPSNVRELEGIFNAAPKKWARQPVFGLLATSEPVSKGCQEALNMSRKPLLLFEISVDGAMRGIHWNHTAHELALIGYGVTTAYVPDGTDEKGMGIRATLNYLGEPLPVQNVPSR